MKQRRAFATLSRFAGSAVLVIQGQDWPAVAACHGTSVRHTQSMVRKVFRMASQRLLRDGATRILPASLIAQAKTDPGLWIDEIKRLAGIWQGYSQHQS